MNKEKETLNNAQNGNDFIADVSGSAFISAWVVRNSAFSIQCGGLERLFIHFSKPTYLLEKISEKDRDTPFGYISEMEGGIYKKCGWSSGNTSKIWVQPQSVGNWLGYENPISEFIWKKLQDHFHNEPFDDWHLLEKEGRSKIEDFCLEIRLSVSLADR